MSLCGKCKVEFGNEEGYTTCHGCQQRYHYPCSVSSNTWKAKSSKDKEDWRCEACRKLLKTTGSTNTNLKSLATSTGETVSDFDYFSNYLKEFCDGLDAKICTLAGKLDNSVKNRLTNSNNDSKNLITALTTKLDNIISTVSSIHSNQAKLIQENVHLKNELASTNEKVRTLEQKMSEMLSHLSLNKQTTEPTANLGDGHSNTAGGRSYNAVLKVPTPQSLSHLSAPSADHRSSSQTLSDMSRGGASRTQHGQRSRTGSAQHTPTSGNVGGAGVGSRPGRQGTGAQRDNNDWTTVSHRKFARPPPKIGTKPTGENNASAPMVKPMVPVVRSSALFVSRFMPEVTCEEIHKLISSVSLSRLKITKIKPRYDSSYSSFHIDVASEDFPKIDDVTLWPDGCLFKPYGGRLRPELVLTEFVPAGSGFIHT